MGGYQYGPFVIFKSQNGCLFKHNRAISVCTPYFAPLPAAILDFSKCSRVRAPHPPGCEYMYPIDI